MTGAWQIATPGEGAASTLHSMYGKVPYMLPHAATMSRLDLRLNPTDKERISRAASLRGVAVSAFVRDAVLREAEQVMAAQYTVTLSGEESKRFLKAFDQPFRPNERLKRALARVDGAG